MRVSAVQVSHESFWPMALFASLLIDLNSFGLVDRPLEVVGQGGEELMDSVLFGLNKPLGAGTDVASGAVHARVRRVLISDELRFHRRVAGLSAKLHGFRDRDSCTARRNRGSIAERKQTNWRQPGLLRPG